MLCLLVVLFCECWFGEMENEEVPSAPSTPATPGTPGAPLFGGFKAERSGNGRRSLLKNCKCFSAEEWAMEEGTLPKLSCSLPPPPVPLAKKVHFYLSHKLTHIFVFVWKIITKQYLERV